MSVASAACARTDHESAEEQLGAQASSNDALRVYYDEARSEVIVETPPRHLPANADHQPGHHNPPERAVFPVSGWMHGYAVEVVDGHGVRRSNRLVHHMNLILPERRELFSPIMQRVGAAGAETRPVKLPGIVGFRVAAGDTLLLLSMLHNPTPDSLHHVVLRVRIPFTPEPIKLPRMAVQPFYVDVMPPSGAHAFDLPPGRSTRSWEGSPAVAGRVLGIGGHLHRYGVALRFEDITANKLIWEASPRLGKDGEVAAMPSRMYVLRPGPVLDPTHVYRLTAVYDNPTGRTLPLGGMGTLGGILRPARTAEWPRADRAHPEYRQDMHTLFVGGYEPPQHSSTHAH